jgi:hypothetical protein
MGKLLRDGFDKFVFTMAILDILVLMVALFMDNLEVL